LATTGCACEPALRQVGRATPAGRPGHRLDRSQLAGARVRLTDPAVGVRRLVLLVTSPRVAPGLLTWDAWQAVHAGPVFTNDQDHPQLPALAAAGVVVEAADPELPPVGLVRLLRSAAQGSGPQHSGTATWLAGPAGDEPMARALADLAVQAADVGSDLEMEVLHGS